LNPSNTVEVDWVNVPEGVILELRRGSKSESIEHAHLDLDVTIENLVARLGDFN
jgi:hypothetical protein